MNEVAITASYYHTLANRTPKLARERHVQFYRDLYHLHGKSLSQETFCEGPGYSYTELGMPILDICAKAGELNNLDLVVVVYWSHEFDPDHSSCGPFFAHHYKIKGQILDVCDCGSVSLFMALNIIQQYLRHGTVKKSMLLALEQTSIPRDKSEHALVPSTNAAAALLMDAQDNFNGYTLLNVDVILEHHIGTLAFNAARFLKDKCQELNIAPDQLMIVIKRNSFFYKNYQCCEITEPEFCRTLKINALDPANGFMPVLFYLNQAINAVSADCSHLMLIDEDVESLNTGYLILCKI